MKGQTEAREIIDLICAGTYIEEQGQHLMQQNSKIQNALDFSQRTTESLGADPTQETHADQSVPSMSHWQRGHAVIATGGATPAY